MGHPCLPGRLGWCWFLLVVALTQPVLAEDGSDRLWNFAGSLYQEQEFYQALGEYERFLFLFPNDPRIFQAELQIGRCYWKNGRLDKAFNRFMRMFGSEATGALRRTALLEAIDVLEQQNRYPEAIYWSEIFIENHPDDPGVDTQYIRLAWLHIDSGSYEQALGVLDRVPPESKHYSQAGSLIQELQDREDVPRKSPGLAGTLSGVLPGAGHLYVGRPGQATASFLLNALFIGAAVAAFKHDSPVLGGILVFFELGWYQGGIRSAAAAARQTNELEEKQYRRELKRRYQLSLGLSPGVEHLALSIKLDF
jgi:tetratricopeptide (TPR) repeat protein